MNPTVINGYQVAGADLLALTVDGHDVMHLRYVAPGTEAAPLKPEQIDAINNAVINAMGFATISPAKAAPDWSSEPARMLAVLKTGRELMDEAMSVHIYGDDETPDADCYYTAWLAEADAVLAAPGDLGELTRLRSALSKIRGLATSHSPAVRSAIYGVATEALGGDGTTAQVEPGADPAPTSAAPRMPLTSDLGLLIRDMIEARAFNLIDLGGEEPETVGSDRVDSVDVSDADNPIIYTASGARFVVRVIREG